MHGEKWGGEFLHPQNRALMSGPWELFGLTAGPDTHPGPFRLGDSQPRELRPRAVLPNASARTRRGPWRCHVAICLGSFAQCLLSTDSVPASFGYQGHSRDQQRQSSLAFRKSAFSCKIETEPLAGVAQWTEHGPANPNWFDPPSELVPGLWAGSPVGGAQEATTH